MVSWVKPDLIYTFFMSLFSCAIMMVLPKGSEGGCLTKSQTNKDVCQKRSGSISVAAQESTSCLVCATSDSFGVALSRSCCSRHPAACPCNTPLRQVLLSPPCRGGGEGSTFLRAPRVFRSHRFPRHQTASLVCFWGCVLCCQLGELGRLSKSSCFFRTWNQTWKTPTGWPLWQADRHFFQPGKQRMVNPGLEGTVL